MQTPCEPERVAALPRLLVEICVIGLAAPGLAEVLRAHGHEVVVDLTVEYGHLETADLLVLALADPEPPALAVLMHVRERSGVPVLAIVPSLTAEDRRHLLDAGADGWLDADCPPQALLATVEEIVATPRTRPGSRTRGAGPPVPPDAVAHREPSVPGPEHER